MQRVALTVGPVDRHDAGGAVRGRSQSRAGAVGTSEACVRCIEEAATARDRLTSKGLTIPSSRRAAPES